MCDHVLPGDEGPAVVSEVPGEGDVRATQVLAGVVQVHAEGDGAVLDKALVILVQVIHLAEGHSKGNLI